MYSIVEVAPKVMVGLLVELMAVVAAPENPLVFAVLNVPLIVAVPGVVPNVTILVPASMVEPAAMVKVLELANPMLKLPVENKLPVLKFPTAIFPATFDDVIAALKVAPVALVLLKYKLR